ncbi:MAG: hypothetical protein GX456_09335 [Verrucomicrobia bacterium]|nr:hypothetical protein [Verrucomicrobiota bacterium]
MLHDQAHEAVSPEGGTLAAVGVASPKAQDNRSPLEYRVYAEHRQFSEQCFMIRLVKLFRLKAGL